MRESINPILKKDLGKLVKGLKVNNSPNDRQRTYYNKDLSKPHSLMSKEIRKLDVYGDNCEFFEKVLNNLRDNQLLNHLETNQISVELVEYLTDILDKNLNRKELNESIDMFWQKISSPFFEWKVFFPLNDFDEDLKIEIKPFRIVNGYLPEKTVSELPKVIEEYIQYPALEVTILDNNSHSAIVKATKRFIEFSGILTLAHRKSSRTGKCKISLPEIKFYYRSDKDYYSFIASRLDPRVGCSSQSRNSERFEHFLKEFKFITKKSITDRTEIERRIFRSLEWYYKVNMTADLSEKIIFFFSALESLLTTIDDKLKGAAIVIRSNLLSLRLTHRFTINQDFYLWLYEVRSYLIHGRVDLSSKTPVYNRSFFNQMETEFKIRSTLELEYLKVVEGILKKKEDFQNERFIDFILWLDKKDEIFENLYQWFKKNYPSKTILEFFDKNKCTLEKNHPEGN